VSGNKWILDAEWKIDGSKIHCVVVRSIDDDEVRSFLSPLEMIHWLDKEKPTHLIGHNIIEADKYILEQLWHLESYFKDIEFIDTMVMSRLDDPVRKGGHNLDNLGKIVGCPKGEHTDFENYSWRMLEYCKQDTLVTLKVYKWLEKRCKPYQAALDLEHQLQHILARMRHYGFLLDVQRVTDLKLELEAELWQIEQSLQEVFPDKVEVVQLKTKTKIVRTPFNPGSRKQVAERLIELGWQPTHFTKPSKTYPKGQPIVDEATLEGVDIPEAQVIQRFFLLQKRISQLEQWLEYVEADGRVRCNIMGIGAITHRAAHTSPNLAQVVKAGNDYGEEFRSCWIVPEGKVLVGVDLKSLEGRVMCHYSRDMEYAKAVCHGNSKDGTDIHTINMRGFGITSRDDAKTAYYALMYGAGAEKIGKILKCSKDEAREKIDNFYDSLPLLKALKAKVDRLAKKGWLPGLDGRRVEVRSAHAALNTLFQSAGAIIAKKWLVIARQLLDEAGLTDVEFVIWVHDEVQIECMEGQQDEVMRILKDAAVLAGEALQCRVPIEADAKYGKNWFETH
jgi:DNA polymerase-1